MDDESHIGFVDSHPKGYRSYDNVNILHEEGILRLTTGGGIHTCMVSLCLNVVGAEDFC